MDEASRAGMIFGPGEKMVEKAVADISSRRIRDADADRRLAFKISHKGGDGQIGKDPIRPTCGDHLTIDLAAVVIRQSALHPIDSNPFHRNILAITGFAESQYELWEGIDLKMFGKTRPAL